MKERRKGRGRYPGPPGVDGFFYLKQIETLAGGKGFYFKDYSLAFLLPVVITSCLNDSLLAFRLSISFTWFIITLSVLALTLRLMKSFHTSAINKRHEL